MTRARDISNVITDANLSGTLDVSGAFTSLGIDDNADATAITIDSSERVNIGTGTPPTADSVLTVQKSSAANELNIISSPSHASVVNLGDTDDYNICRIKADNSDNSLQFQTNNAERMRIPTSDSRSVLAIGDSTVYTGILSTSATNSSLISMNSGGGSEIVLSHHDALSTSGLGSIAFNRGTANLATIDSACDGATDSANLRFSTTSSGGSITERMRIDSSGNILIADTTVDKSAMTSGSGLTFNSSGQILTAITASNGHYINKTNYTSGTYNNMVFSIDGSTKGTISCNGTSTSYNTTSDHRLKENMVEMTDATTRLKQLQPKRFNFIADADTTVDGFLAHEVQSVVPEAITGEKDATNEDGSIKPQGIDQSKLVPLLTKTLQEALTRIDTLEAEVKTLKGE